MADAAPKPAPEATPNSAGSAPEAPLTASEARSQGSRAPVSAAETSAKAAGHAAPSSTRASPHQAPHASPTLLGLDLADLGRAWWAQRGRIGAFTAVCTLVALVVTLVLTPRFEAGTRLLVEPSASLVTVPEPGQRADTRERLVLDQEAVASQVELIRSRDVALAVIEELGLTDRIEFSGQGALDNLLALVGLGPDEQSVLGETVESYTDRLRVFHIPDTRVIGLTFWSHDPELAARGADAIARAFLKAQVADKQGVSLAATEYLGQEIARMRDRVAEAERAVQDFRARSGLIAGANDTTLPAQNLSELNTELTRARASRIDAEGQAAQIRRALATDAAQGLGTAGDSAFIQSLLQRQGTVQGDLADASTTLGPSHPRIRQLQAQLRDINEQVRREARRVANNLDEEARTAQARERALRAEMASLQGEAADAGLQDVELRALEREAKAQRDLLETLLSRYRQASAAQDPGAQPADARIISSASVPLEPSFPKIVPTVLFVFFGALLVASGVVLSGAIMAPMTAPMSSAPARPRAERRAEPHWPDETETEERAAPTLAASEPLRVTPTPAGSPSAKSVPADSALDESAIGESAPDKAASAEPTSGAPMSAEPTSAEPTPAAPTAAERLYALAASRLRAAPATPAAAPATTPPAATTPVATPQLATPPVTTPLRAAPAAMPVEASLALAHSRPALAPARPVSRPAPVTAAPSRRAPLRAAPIETGDDWDARIFEEARHDARGYGADNDADNDAGRDDRSARSRHDGRDWGPRAVPSDPYEDAYGDPRDDPYDDPRDAPSAYRDPEPDAIATPDGLAEFAASLGAPVRVLMLSPGAPVAGLAAVVLADAFARLVSRRRETVLAVDARRPEDDALEALVGLERAAGLAELLAGEAELEDVLHRLAGCGAHVMPAGDLRGASDLDGADAVLDALGASYETLLVLADADGLDRLPTEAFDAALLFTDGLSGDDVEAWMEGLAARGLPDVALMTAETATGSRAA